MGKLSRAAVLGFLFISFGGCGYLFYPRAGDYREQARGASAVETLINLTSMMEGTADKAKGGHGRDHALDDLHNQYHALHDVFCEVPSAQPTTPAYDVAVTQKQELKAVFKRLWKFNTRQPQRDDHLDLMIAELKALRTTLHTLR